ncbi:MAG: transglutaminaseTgpA domain-containing protein [Chloroflexota bacterium]
MIQSNAQTAIQSNYNALHRFRYTNNVYFQDGQALTIILTALCYLTVAVSLDAAGYVKTLTLLMPVTLGSILVGTLMSFSRFDGFFALTHSMFTGFAWILYMMTSLVEPSDIKPFLDNGIPELQAQVYYILLQLLEWVDDALRNTANQDNYVFIFELAFLIWWLTFLGTWSIIRYGYTWRAIIPAGAVLVINTYYAPDSTFGFFVFFCLIALLLLIRTNLAENQMRWREQRVYFNPDIAIDVLRNGFTFTVLVLGITILGPSLGRNPQVRGALAPINEQWQETTERWSQLYEGINRQTVPVGSSFGRSLTLGGARNVTDTPVMQVDAAVGRYWRAVVYDMYDGRGWMNTTDVTREYEAQTPIPVGGWGQRRPITQTITLLNTTGGVIFGTPDIRRSSVPLSGLIRPSTSEAIFYPPGSANVDVGEAVADTGGELVQAYELTWSRSTVPLEIGDSYTVVSHYADITQRALQEASTDYPPQILETYLQLPENMSARVMETARTIAEGHPTAYAKVKAVETYLRGFEYREDIEAPAPDVDPVEYFLYDIQAGYCDYYATSMAVMLRSLGIPARTASGYAEGAFDEEGKVFVVTERDAHTWVEVYFPNYGWIEFEPTAGESALIRPSGNEASTGGRNDVNPINAGDEQNPFEDELLQDDLNAGGPNIPEDGELLTGEGEIQRGWGYWLWSLLTPILLIVGLTVIWRTRFVGPTAFTPDLPFLLYDRMERWAIRLGFRPYQTNTPYEQARTLSKALPEGKPQIDTITDTYVRYRFSPEQSEQSSESQTAQPAQSTPQPISQPTPQSSQVIGAWQQLQPMFIRSWLRNTIDRFLRRVGLAGLFRGRGSQHPYNLDE